MIRLVICALGVLVVGVVAPEINSLYHGRYRSLQAARPAAAHRPIGLAGYQAPAPTAPLADRRSLDRDYIVLAIDPSASLDGLDAPRMFPPRICGPFAVLGIWGYGSNSVFSGVIQNGAGVGALSIAKVNHPTAQTWQGLIGTNTWTGATTIGDRSAMTVKPGPVGWSTAWTIGSDALLCLDADLLPNATTAWTAPAALRITYTNGTGAVYLDGALTVTAGAAITVSDAPPLYPTTLLVAANGITGAFAAASLPAGYRIVQTTDRIYLDIIR